MIASALKRRLAWGLGTAAIAAVALLVVGLALVNTPAVHAEIQRRLSQALDGQVSWESLDVGLLPAPRAELRKVRLEMPGRVSAAADELKVYLRLWPLLWGQVEVASVTVARPQIRILAAGADSSSDAPPDAVALYRAAMDPVARALRQFAPDMAFRLDEATVEIGAGMALRDLRALARTDAKGVDFEVTAAANLWNRLSGRGRLEYQDLVARATIALDGLVLDKDVPAAALRMQVSADAKSALEYQFDGSLGTLVAMKGRFVLPAGKPPELAAELSRFDLAQALAIARLKGARLDVIEAAEGNLSGRLTASLGPSWQLHLDVVGSDAAVKLAPLPWKLSAHAAQVTVTGERVRVTGLRGALGESRFSNAAFQIDLDQPARLSAASGQATLKIEQWFPWLQTQVPLEEVAALTGSIDVALHRLALRFDRPEALDFDAAVTPRNVSATLKALPAPVSVAGGSLRAGPERVSLEKLAVAMLDARALVSGSFTFKNSALDLALGDGAVGEKLVRWALERAGAPQRLEPKTPLRFAAQRIAWAPQGALEADARLEFDRGPEVGLALAWRPELLQLRRVAIKDARSNAVLGATVAADLIQASFSGTLHGGSIAAMLRRPEGDSGIAQGELKLTIDRAQPQNSVADGRLRIDGLDLTWLAGRKALVERVDLVVEPAGLRIAEAQFNVDDQVVRLRGNIRRSEQGPIIEAAIESPGIVLDRLLTAPAEKPAAPAQEPAPGTAAARIWPLPVSGRIEVRSAFVQFQRYRVEPFEGSLTLEPERARLEVKEARLCGVSFPLELEASSGNLSVAAHIRMKDEPLEKALPCLTEGRVQLTGNADLQAELRTQGKRAELVRNLTGTAQAELRNGQLKRFALIGNILSLRNIADVAKVQEQEGFPYRSMTARGHFERGGFLVEEGFFDSDAVRLAASGRIDLLGADSRLTVLVGLLTSVERVVGSIPLLGDVFGGTMLALPVSVTGDIRNPSVVPLGPRAVSDQLLGIFERTLKLPGKLMVPPEAKPP